MIGPVPFHYLCLPVVFPRETLAQCTFAVKLLEDYTGRRYIPTRGNIQGFHAELRWVIVIRSMGDLTPCPLSHRERGNPDRRHWTLA
jgi:hypothetical protein